MAENLLILTTYYPHERNPMSGIFVKRQVEELRKYFDKVYVIAVNPSIPKSLMFIRRIPQGTKDINYAHDYSYSNVDVFFLRALPFGYHSSYGKRLLKKVEKLINEKKLSFKIIHAHFSWPAGYIASKIKNRHSKPMILTVHENRDWLLHELAMQHPKLLETWFNADKIIRVNKIDLEAFQKLGIASEKLVSIPNGYPSDTFKILDKSDSRKKLNLDQSAEILLSIGNLEEYKGHVYLIDAMKQITKNNSNVVLFILGEGSLHRKLATKITELKLQDNIFLLGGNKPSEEIPLWFNSCDTFVIPSISEGNPTVMFEALGCGKPIIATKVGGVPEIINDDRYGYLVNPKSANELAEAINRALGKQWNNKEIHDYSKQFTWANIAKQIMKVYDF